MTQDDSQNELFLTASQLFARWQCSHMFVVGRLKTDPQFPKPLYFGRHRRWRLSDVQAYEQVIATRGRPAAA